MKLGEMITLMRDSDQLRERLRTDPTLIDAQNDYDHRTLLHYLSEATNIPLHDVPPAGWTNNDEMRFQVALILGNASVLLPQLKPGAFNIQDIYGNTPLHILALECCRLSDSFENTPNSEMQPVFDAFKTMFAQLIEKASPRDPKKNFSAPDMKTNFFIVNETGDTFLHLLAEEKKASLIEIKKNLPNEIIDAIQPLVEKYNIEKSAQTLVETSRSKKSNLRLPFELLVGISAFFGGKAHSEKESQEIAISSAKKMNPPK